MNMILVIKPVHFGEYDVREISLTSIFWNWGQSFSLTRLTHALGISIRHHDDRLQWHAIGLPFSENLEMETCSPMALCPCFFYHIG